MKMFKLSACAMALVLMAGACSNDTKPKTIAETHPANQADSLSYYVGVSAANAYYQQSQQDSTLKNDKGKEEFLAGVSKGLNAIDGMSESYKSGYMLGLQMAMSVSQTQDQLDVTLNKNQIYQGLVAGVKVDSIAKNPKAQEYLQKCGAEMQKKKVAKDAKAAAKNLTPYAKQGYTKVSETMYKKTVKPGDAALTKGANVGLTMEVKDAKGKAIQSPLPPKTDVVIGQTIPDEHVVAKALNQMKMGEQAEFAIAAVDLFNGQPGRVGLNNDDVVVLVLTTGAPQAKAEPQGAPAPATAAPAPAQGK